MGNSENLKTRVERIAKSKGYVSMSELAQATGLNYANLTRVVNGRQKGDRTVMKLARFLGTSYEWLATGRGLCTSPGEGCGRVHGNGNATVNNVNNGSTQTNNVELHTESAGVLREKIRLLEEKIRLLEERIADKDRIISLLSGR